MKLIPNVSKEAKQTLMGGVVASLAVNLESGLSWFVPAYPQFLKDKLIAQLPRNGALVANLAPTGVAYYVKKKGRSSAKMDNVATGMMLYDLPKLLNQIVYNVAYTAGLPAQAFGRVMSRPFTLNIRPNNQLRPIMNGTRTFAGSVAGKYTLKTSPTKPALMGGLGKYR